MSNDAIGSTAPSPRPAATAASAAAWRRTSAAAGSPRSAPPLDGPANEGHTCLKGRFAHQFTRSRDRLTSPLIREGGELPRRQLGGGDCSGSSPSSTRIKDEHGPDAIAGLASSRATNEDCYAMQRLIRAAIGTNNIDNCSRVCHSPTSFALRKSLGLSGATGSFSRHRPRRRGDPHRRQPDRGPPGRRRADQAGGAARAASWSRSTRAGSSWPTTACCTSRRGPGTNAAVDARARPRRRAATGSPTATSSTSAPRATRRSRSCSRPTRPTPSRRSPASPPPTSSAAAHIYGEADDGLDPVGPRRHRAQVRLGGRPADLQPRA